MTRADAIREIGCVCCLLTHRLSRPPDLHHPYGQKGKNRDVFYGLCPWHHRGVCDEGYSNQHMSGILGPSLAWGKTPFLRYFGSEEKLLKVQDFLIEQFESVQWVNYATPTNIRRKAIKLWKSD